MGDNNSFPFGKDPKKATEWLGLNNSPSRRWSAAYSSTISLGCGFHSLIFLAHDNLQIGVVHLAGCGPSVGFGTGKLLRGTGKAGRIRDPSLERAVDRNEDVVNYSDYFNDVRSVEEADTGLKLLALLNNNGTEFVTDMPMSFWDLSQAWGTISGFSVDVMVAGAQLYRLDISPDVIAGERMYVRDQQVYNLDDGSIGVSVSRLDGKWNVERTYDLWHEYSEAALASLKLDHRPAESPNIQPLSKMANNIHPFLRQLPIVGYPISDTLVSRHFEEPLPAQ
ncbi:hypothetical protein GGQ73_004718 [Rhizobium skierniewicense]|uniref:Uncharacterized protein n=1 Tax=Rhizobium skierniewicense TaxID=984260 RepID=A0A7W6G3Z5_9HYPH|nr:hypothetical protein [Rhizobium skierniewicense]MBB3948723.1 hypothetical protein [Rhizobium skierniewicense]